MGIRSEAVRKGIEIDSEAVLELQAELKEFAGVLEAGRKEEIETQLKYHRGRLVFFAFQLVSAERDDENDRLIELGRTYEAMLTSSEPVEYKELGGSKHVIVCTSKALVILSNGMNHLGHDLEDPSNDEQLGSGIAAEGKMSYGDVLRLTEEWYTNLPGQYDKHGEPTDGFDEDDDLEPDHAAYKR